MFREVKTKRLLHRNQEKRKQNHLARKPLNPNWLQTSFHLKTKAQNLAKKRMREGMKTKSIYLMVTPLLIQLEMHC